MPNSQYIHIKTGSIYTHIDNYGSFMIFKSIHSKKILYVTKDFIQYYRKLK